MIVEGIGNIKDINLLTEAQEHIAELEMELSLMNSIRPSQQEIDDMEKENQRLEKQVQEIKALRDRLENGIRYDEEANQYIVVWTAQEIEEVNKEAQEICKVLGLNEEKK